MNPLIKKQPINPNNYNFEGAITSFTDYLDMADKFLATQPCFYTREKLWWAWNHETLSWDMVDQIDLLNMITKKTYGLKTFETKTKAEILNALTQKARLKIPLDAPKTWVQYKDIIIDVKTGDKIKPSPKLGC
jgi:hypothetical protein